jgi:hypothetical protein
VVEFLASHWNIIAAAAIVLAMFGVPIFRVGYAASSWVASKIPAATAAEPVTDDASDLAAFHRLTRRFERMKCKEGMAAMKVAGTHFLACPEIAA